MDDYKDIIRLPHHISSKRIPMQKANRAAQFAPFAALTGHEAALRETARLTSEKQMLSEEQAEILNRKIAILQEQIQMLPLVTVTYFVPDEHKAGGCYTTLRGNLRIIDTIQHLLIFKDKTEIRMENVLDITFPSVFQ